MVAHEEIAVYVPASEGGCRYPRPGSAIVGSPFEDKLRIDYEDGQFNPTSYADLVARAWSRHAENYPTVARAWVDPETLIQVGWFDPNMGTLEITEPDLLEAWHPGALGELETMGGMGQRRRELDAYLTAHPEIRYNPMMLREVKRMCGIRD